jgi:hypothetical protein
VFEVLYEDEKFSNGQGIRLWKFPPAGHEFARNLYGELKCSNDFFQSFKQGVVFKHVQTVQTVKRLNTSDQLY